MTPENLIKELERYRNELAKIMDRFSQTDSGLHMNHEDDPRLRTIVIELIDLINDSIPDNRYSTIIQDTYNRGYSQFYLSYSYKCVEDIIATLTSIITRIKRNPELCDSKKVITQISDKTIEYPDKITFKWLWHNVPYSFWFWLVSALIAALLFGVSIGQSKLYQDLMTKNDSGRSSLENDKRDINAVTPTLDKKTLLADEEKQINDLMYEFGSLGINLQTPAKCDNAEFMKKYNKAKSLLVQIETRSKAIEKYSQYEQFLNDNKQWIHSTSDDCL